jgi:hypothetical protein
MTARNSQKISPGLHNAELDIIFQESIKVAKIYNPWKDLRNNIAKSDYSPNNWLFLVKNPPEQELQPEVMCVLNTLKGGVFGFIFGFPLPLLFGKYGLLGGSFNIHPDDLLPVYGPKLPWKRRLHYTHLIPNARLFLKKAGVQSKIVAKEILTDGWRQAKLGAKCGVAFEFVESFIEYWRGRSDMWNVFFGGGAAGIVFAGTRNPRGLLIAACGGGAFGVGLELFFGHVLAFENIYDMPKENSHDR